MSGSPQSQCNKTKIVWFTRALRFRAS